MPDNAPDNLESYNRPTVLQKPGEPPTIASQSPSRVTVNTAPRRAFGEYELLENWAAAAWVSFTGVPPETDRTVALKMILQVGPNDDNSSGSDRGQAAAR